MALVTPDGPRGGQRHLRRAERGRGDESGARLALLQGSLLVFGAPFLIAGGLKAIYDLSLWGSSTACACQRTEEQMQTGWAGQRLTVDHLSSYMCAAYVRRLGAPPRMCAAYVRSPVCCAAHTCAASLL